MRSSKRWLWALTLAWGGAVAIVLAPRTDILAAALCMCWLGLVATVLSRNGRRRAIACLLAVALPMQGLAAARFQSQGAAHVHGSGSQAHSHANVQRHFHVAAADAIEVEDGHDRALKHAAQGKSSPLGAVDAASACSALVAPPGAAFRVARCEQASFTEHHPHFPDRPPRRAG